MFAKTLTHALTRLISLGICTAFAGLCPTTGGFAQQSGYRYDGPSGGFYAPVPPYGPDMFFTYHHASTALEGALRGRAALIHAQGNYLVSASQAAILWEQAEWLALDNRRRWVEYRIGRRMWREFERQARTAKKRGAKLAG